MYKTSTYHQVSLRCQFYKERCTEVCHDWHQCCDGCNDLYQCCVLYNISKIINHGTCLNDESTEEPYDIQCKKFPWFVMKQTGNICFQAYFFLFDHNTFFCIKGIRSHQRSSLRYGIQVLHFRFQIYLPVSGQMH